jgi:hypothetical protein
MIRIIMDTTTTTMEMVVIMGTEGWQAVEGTGTTIPMGGMKIGETIGAQTGPLGKAEAVAVEVAGK